MASADQGIVNAVNDNDDITSVEENAVITDDPHNETIEKSYKTDADLIDRKDNLTSPEVRPIDSCNNSVIHIVETTSIPDDATKQDDNFTSIQSSAKNDQEFLDERYVVSNSINNNDDMGTDNMNENPSPIFNDTLDLENNSNDYIDSVNTIEVDIENTVFVDEYQPSKRSGKYKLLQEEAFDKTIYVNKQCGFTTNRPLYWATLIENYVATNPEVHGKKSYKTLKNSDKFFIIKFMIYYQNTKHIDIFINLITGTLLVKGPNFENWIDEEFHKVSNVDTPSEDLTIINPGLNKELEAVWFNSNINKAAIDNSQADLYS